MELYLTDRFLSAFSCYFMIDVWKDDEIWKKAAFLSFRQKERALLESFESHRDIETIQTLFRHVTTSNYVNKNRFVNYQRLKAECNLSTPDMLNLLAVLFILERENKVSFPARSILYDHYLEIVLKIAHGSAVSLVFCNDHDIERFKESVYTVLSNYYILAFCSPTDLSLWGEHYEDVGKEPSEPELGHAKEEYETVNCYVHITDIETVKRIKKSKYIAAYCSNDVDRGVSLIGNFLTFSTGLHSVAVTFQITGHMRFDSFEEMYFKLGTEAFGYDNKAYRVCAKETEHFFAKYCPEGALALKVKQLTQPILSMKAFEQLRKKESEQSGKLTKG